MSSYLKQEVRKKSKKIKVRKAEKKKSNTKSYMNDIETKNIKIIRIGHLKISTKWIKW